MQLLLLGFMYELYLNVLITIMGNAAGSADISQGRDLKETRITSPECAGPQKQTAGLKLPMPSENELEERFNAALVSPEEHYFV